MFVGSQRREIVDDLVAAFDAVAAGEGPQLWSLVAPSGAGKSRIVHELYARLAAERQGDDGARPYWPPSIAPVGEDRSLLADRKLTHPHGSDGRLVVPDGLEIPWMWWGLNCLVSTDGGYGQILIEEETQLRDHVDISSSDDREARIHERLEAGGAVVGFAVALLAVGGAMLSIVLSVLTLGQAVLRSRGRLRRVVEQRVAALRRRRGEAPTRRIDVEGSGRERQVEVLATSILRRSERTPFVIFIEDAHDADDGVVALVERILGSGRARVLLVATVHPEAGRSPGPLDRFVERASAVAALAPRIHRVRLARLDQDDLREVVLELHRRGSGRDEPPDDATIDRILETYGSTVLYVHRFFACSRVTRVLPERPLGLDDLESIPTDVSSLIRDSLAALDPGLGLVLTLAANAGMRFVVEPVAAEARRILPDCDVEQHLQDAVEHHGLLRRRADGTLVFVDDAIWDVARMLAADHLAPQDLRMLDRRLAEHSIGLAERIDPGPGAETSWSIHHALVREGRADGPEAVPALTRSAQLLASRSAVRDAVEVLSTAIEHAREDERLDLRTLRVHWELDLARGERALAEVDELLDAAVDPTLRLVLELLRVQALQECADLPAALRELEGLLPRIATTFDPASAPVLAARNLEAVLLLRTGRAVDAGERFAALVEERTRASGPTSRSTLATRTMAARATGESGRTDEAVRLFSALVAEQREVLGPYAPETFNARANLVRFMAESGDVASARAEAESLLADSSREIGEDHPRTLARWNLLVHVSELGGDHLAAVEGFRAVLARKEQVLGVDHPHTQITRMDLARNLLGADLVEDAIVVLQPLVTWAVRALDPLDPLRLAAEATRLLALARVGRSSADDVAALSALVDRATAGLGPLAIPTVLLRNHHAQAIGALGHPQGAVALLGPLVDDIEGRLGATHRHTMAVRSNLARWLAATDPTAAASSFQSLEVDLASTLGVEHPYTRVVTRSLRTLGAGV